MCAVSFVHVDQIPTSTRRVVCWFEPLTNRSQKPPPKKAQIRQFGFGACATQPRESRVRKEKTPVGRLQTHIPSSHALSPNGNRRDSFLVDRPCLPSRAAALQLWTHRANRSLLQIWGFLWVCKLSDCAEIWQVKETDDRLVEYNDSWCGRPVAEVSRVCVYIVYLQIRWVLLPC